MKITYLINKPQANGNVELAVAARCEWQEIVNANKQLPPEQQRFFIRDCIADGDELDWMIIETTREEYLAWHKEHESCARNRALRQEFKHLSADVVVNTGNDFALLVDMIPSPDCVEDDCCGQMLMESLRQALAAWKPWANDLLDMYLQGQKRTCSKVLAEKFSISERMIRKYKIQFENFIKNFLSEVPF